MLIGKFGAKLQAGECSTLWREPLSHPLLSEDTSKKLSLVKYNKGFMVKKVGSSNPKIDLKNVRHKVASMIQEHKEVSSGKLSKSKALQVTMMVDEIMKPVVQKARRIPHNFM